MHRSENPQVGITANDGVITVGITAKADSPAAALELLDEKSRQICSRLGQFLFGRDQQTLAQVVGELLVRKNQSLALAESCTGGLIGKLLSDVPGASKFFLADLVTYANQAKIQLLGVPEKILEKQGGGQRRVCPSHGCRGHCPHRGRLGPGCYRNCRPRRWYERKTCWTGLYRHSSERLIRQGPRYRGS